jgi:transposase InsO family protein
MLQKLHQNAKTNYAIRLAIKQSHEPILVLAARYHLSWQTVKKWRERDSLEDKSSRPHRLRTDLTTEQIERILFERKQFKKTVEDIFFTLEDEIPNLYPMKVYRVLARYGLSRLPDEFRMAERKIRKFHRYGIGYLHLDLLYAPKINSERRYIYTAIDRVAKIAFVMLGKRKNKKTGARFLKEVIRFYPYKINYILTDNGFEFSYKALPKNRKTKKIHPFDKICQENKIQHRTIKFKHPWTNGMVERFNRTLKDQVLKKYLFSSIFEMNGKLIEFVNQYNFEKRLKSLSYQTPAQYLKGAKNISLQRIVS